MLSPEHDGLCIHELPTVIVITQDQTNKDLSTLQQGALTRLRRFQKGGGGYDGQRCMHILGCLGNVRGSSGGVYN